MRRADLKISDLMTVVALLLAMPLFARGERPNVVVILADDLGWADVGYHDEKRADTPNIDALAAEGIELNRFYVAPMCSPTRAGLVTGRYPIRFGLAKAVIPPYRNFGLSTSERLLPEALAELGYKHRAIFGKWHLGHLQRKWHPLSRGFTHFRGHYNGAIDYFDHSREKQPDWHVDFEPSSQSGYTTDLIAAAAADFIGKHAAADEPYFCYVPFNAPHSPFQAKRDDLVRYQEIGGQPDLADGPQSKRPRGRKVDAKTRRQALKAMIWSMDEGIGKILQAIDESGERDNTQVWFFSDNGGISALPNNNLPLRGDKLSVFEGGVRVPACVRWPAQWPGGRKVEQVMGYIDVAPTVVASAGGELSSLSKELDGRDLSDALSGKAKVPAPRTWFSYHGQSGPDREHLAVMTDEWKLVVLGPKLGSQGLAKQHQAYLFNIARDPYEAQDVSAQHPQVVKELTQQLIQYRALQPANAVDVYGAGRAGFVAPRNWQIPQD